MEAEQNSKNASYREYIDTLAVRKVKGFCGTIDDEGAYYSEVYAGNASLADSITADYHGRFLIELIQNANDVHPDDRFDGEIEILFDKTSGEFGTLNIANRGAAFSKKNVNALCDMGLSSKPPGESIGNKGLGFRSVHHITDRPLIYSQLEGSAYRDHFEGYCFSFADEEDLDSLIKDPRHRNLARRDLPLFHVPVWLSDQPDLIRDFASRGFATVISLPIRDSSATDTVVKEIAAIQSQGVPLLLFLTRLERLTIRSREVDSVSEFNFSLVRQESLLPIDGHQLSIVDLGESGTFLISRRQVSEESMKAAIREGTDNKQLHKHWLKWEGTGELALAVRMGGMVPAPRLYTYLPMGEQASAPFSGYLHGSFFPSSNRKGLDASIKLNQLLLNEATTLASATIVLLTQNELAEIDLRLNVAAKACAVVDLLCWRKVDSLETTSDLATQVARKVAAGMGTPSFDEAPVVPCLASEMGAESTAWHSPAAARHWPFELENFSSKVAASHSRTTNISPIWTRLGQRTDHLNTFLSKHAPRYKGLPDAAERAELAAQVASTLFASAMTKATEWASFYKDLILFLDRSAGSLVGRRILLCGDRKLRRTMSQAIEIDGKVQRRGRRDQVEASVFAPPARRGTQQTDEEQLTPPASLSGNFAFLADELDWYGDLAPARLFLENGKLIFAFDREVVLGQLSRAVRVDGRNAIHAAGLRWAFQLWLQPREAGRAFKLQSQHRFSVPNHIGDFIDANEAVFSETWPADTQGQLLQSFLTAAPPESDDVNRLAERRLARRSHYAFKGSESAELWVHFLLELGVQRGLHPIALKLSRPVPAYRLNSLSFCEELGISIEAARAWTRGIEEIEPGATNLPSSTDYIVRGDIWWMPGQGDLHRFSRECLEHYSMLIIGWLSSRRLPSWTVEVHHSYRAYADSRNWATPVASFLRSAAWIPADEPSNEGTRPVAVKASDIWLASERGGERFPSFLRRPTIHVMRMLERLGSEQIDTLRQHCHLHVLNQPDTLGQQAEFLAEQYRGEGFDRYFERHFLNLYYKTWSLLADSVNADDSTIKNIAIPHYIVVRRGRQIEVVHLLSPDEDPSELIYVRDGDDETIESLVEASGKLLFEARGGNPARIGKLMRKLYADKIRLLSEVNYSMRADEQPLGVGDVAPASIRCPRLRVLVAIAMEALKGAELQRLPTDRFSVIARLDHLEVQLVGSIIFQIDGVEVAQEIEQRRAFALKLPSDQNIVVIRTSGPLTWSTLDEALGAICEAIEQPALEPYLRLLILGLSNSGKPVDESPDIDLELEGLCGLLRLNDNSKRAVRETLGAQLDRIVPWLRAILHMAGGITATDDFAAQESSALKNISKLREAISPWLEAMSLDTDLVLEACKNALSTAELQESLGLDFEQLNNSLLAVGEKPNTYPEFQAAQVLSYVRENEMMILDSLRDAHAEQLNLYQMTPRYRESREAARKLGPRSEWLLRFKEVPADLIAQHVSLWLISQGARSGAAPSILQPLDDVRKRNAVAVTKFVNVSSPLIKAWCTKANVAIPGLWKELDGGAAALREELDRSGIFDFKALNGDEVLEWAVIVGAWPESMPHSVDKEALGIVEADFDVEKAKAVAEAEARKIDARSILFNGTKVDPEHVDWQGLADELSKALSKKMLSTPLGTQTSLLPAKEPSRRSGNSSSGGSWSPPFTRPPSQKTELIGRIGELAVYHWLRDRLPKQNIDAAWQSTNGFPFTGRPGSDSLGFDFAVGFRSQVWQIEVKASLGDPCSFDLGETEVRAGRAAARSRSGIQYWIAYVSNLSDPANARVELLPNPMSEEGEAVLNLLGEGLRYGFRRS